MDKSSAQPNFSGPAYDEELDLTRLTKQHERIAALMIDGRWRTVSEIARVTRYPENSVQAQLRHLRKPRFGAFIVDKRRRGGDECATWEFHLRERTSEDPTYSGGRSTKGMAERMRELELLLEDACEALEGAQDLFLAVKAKEIRGRMK